MKTDLSLVTLFTEASLLVQGVMVLLLVISVLSWTIIFQRTFTLLRAKRWLQQFEHRFQGHYDLNQLYQYLASKRRQSFGIELIFKSGLREFLKLSQKNLPAAVVMEGADRTFKLMLSKEEQQLESQLSFLASVGSISVYIGLFGTVWGIMTAFRALGNVQQATLAMVAPGISEALVATALGLFAAIPAVYAYNRLSFKVQDLIRHYDHLADEFSAVLYRKLHSPESDDAKIEPQ